MATAEKNTKAWDGTLRRLDRNENVELPSTRQGDMILVVFNIGGQNEKGELNYSRGGSIKKIEIPAGQSYCSFVIENFQGSSLKLSNTNKEGYAPLRVGIYGPGFNTKMIKHLPNDGSTVTLKPNFAAEGPAVSGFGELVLRVSGSTIAPFALFNGSKVETFMLNYSGEAPEYTRVVNNNTLSHSEQFRGQRIYIAYFADSEGQSADISLSPQ